MQNNYLVYWWDTLWLRVLIKKETEWISMSSDVPLTKLSGKLELGKNHRRVDFRALTNNYSPTPVPWCNGSVYNVLHWIYTTVLVHLVMLVQHSSMWFFNFFMLTISNRNLFHLEFPIISVQKSFQSFKDHLGYGLATHPRW